MTLDAIRAAHPELGLALYAYTPGSGVTLEVHDAGEVYTFNGATEAAVVTEAFPELTVSQAPSGAGSPPAFQRRTIGAQCLETAEGAAETASVFD